jgi:hypothetical protein
MKLTRRDWLIILGVVGVVAVIGVGVGSADAIPETRTSRQVAAITAPDEPSSEVDNCVVERVFGSAVSDHLTTAEGLINDAVEILEAVADLDPTALDTGPADLERIADDLRDEADSIGNLDAGTMASSQTLVVSGIETAADGIDLMAEGVRDVDSSSIDEGTAIFADATDTMLDARDETLAVVEGCNTWNG